ncbi:MAG: sigma-54-dependent Fis family transcriptional regulator [Myxococcales bacterium]|nr:sigma-54-dependent Fis family transcriptional regulator [Myxococcales bacterium]
MQVQEGTRVLLVDDDHAFGVAMAKALRRRGFHVEIAEGGRAALQALARPADQAPAVAVLDLRMPEVDGLEVLRRTPDRVTPVVVLTGHGTVPDAVECMRLGAYTFLTKPVDAADLAPVLTQAARPLAPEVGHELVGESDATRQLRRLLDRLAEADEPVLLTGETGTGKEVAARRLHQASRRAEQPFLAVNMACLPRDLVESELFGHARGAFTGADRRKAGLFEEVQGGTLFLDEVAELPLEHQAKLLRVLETSTFRSVGENRERAFHGRLVAATHQDLLGLVREGRFREDLYYRLQVLPLELPALRQRRDDIVPIARHWLARVATSPVLQPRGRAAACWPRLAGQRARGGEPVAPRVAVRRAGARGRGAGESDAGGQPVPGARRAVPAARRAAPTPPERSAWRRSNAATSSGCSPTTTTSPASPGSSRHQPPHPAAQTARLGHRSRSTSAGD